VNLSALELFFKIFYGQTLFIILNQSMYLTDKILKPYSCLEVGADVLDIAGNVIASKELKYDPVSNCKPSTAFQISLAVNNCFVISFFRLASSPLQRDKCGIST